MFVGGLNPQTTLASLQPIFEQYGTISHINLVTDHQQLCKGYGFVDFSNPSVAISTIPALNGQPFQSGILKVQYSDPQMRSQFNGQNLPIMPNIGVGAGGEYSAEAAIAAALAMTHAAPPGVQSVGMPVQPMHIPPVVSSLAAQPIPTSRVIVLMNMVPVEELDDPSLYAELVSEISEECRKFGTLISTVVPKEGLGRGKVYLQYEQTKDTAVAYRCLKGRKFGPNMVDCDYYSETSFGNAEYK